MTDYYLTNMCEFTDETNNHCCSKHLRGANCPIKLQPVLNLFLCHDHECLMIKNHIEMHLRNLETDNTQYDIYTNEFLSKIFNYQEIQNLNYLNHIPNSLNREQCLFPYTIQYNSVSYYNDIINYDIQVSCFSNYTSDNILSYSFTFQGKRNVNYNLSNSLNSQPIIFNNKVDRTSEINNIRVLNNDEIMNNNNHLQGITGLPPPLEHLVERLELDSGIISEFNINNNYRNYFNNIPLTSLNRFEIKNRHYFDNILEINNCDICFETNQLGFEFNCCLNKYICIDCVSTWILSNYNSYYELFEIHKNTKHLIKQIDCPFCRKKVHLDKIYSNKVEYKPFIQQFTYQLEKQLKDEIIIIQNKFKEQLNF